MNSALASMSTRASRISLPAFSFSAHVAPNDPGPALAEAHGRRHPRAQRAPARRARGARTSIAHAELLLHTAALTLMGVSDTLGGISDPAPKRKSCRKAKRSTAVRQNRSQFDINSTLKDSLASLASLASLRSPRARARTGIATRPGSNELHRATGAVPVPVCHGIASGI